MFQFLDEEMLDDLTELAERRQQVPDAPPETPDGGGPPPADPPSDQPGDPPSPASVLAAFGHWAPDDSSGGGGGLTAKASAPAEADAEQPTAEAETETSEGQTTLEPGMLVAAQQLLALLGERVGSGDPASQTNASPAESSEPAKGDEARESSSGPPNRRRGPPAFKRYHVPIDDSLLTADSIVYELTLRMLEAGLAQGGRTLARFDVQQLYYQVPWSILPTEQQAIDEVSVALERRKTTIWYDSNALEVALANQDQQNLERMKAHADFERLLADSTYAGDAFLSFFIAHVNGPIALANDGIALAWKGATLNGIITDAEPPQLPKLDYVGEFGQKYGESVLETGAKMGILLVVGGPLATQVGSAGAKVPGLLGGLGNVGNLAFQAARLSMATGAVIDVVELSQVVLSLIYDAATTSGEDRAKAIEALEEIAVYGAFEWIVNRHNKASTKGTGSGSDAVEIHPERGRKTDGETSDGPDTRSPNDGTTSKSDDANTTSPDSSSDSATDATSTKGDVDSKQTTPARPWTNERARGLLDGSEGMSGPGKNTGHARAHVPLDGQDPRKLAESRPSKANTTVYRNERHALQDLRNFLQSKAAEIANLKPGEQVGGSMPTPGPRPGFNSKKGGPASEISFEAVTVRVVKMPDGRLHLLHLSPKM